MNMLKPDAMQKVQGFSAVIFLRHPAIFCMRKQWVSEEHSRMALVKLYIIWPFTFFSQSTSNQYGLVVAIIWFGKLKVKGVFETTFFEPTRGADYVIQCRVI